MEIIRAEHSGFCFGVDRAINLAFTEAERKDREGRLLSCGKLIHNSAVVSKLESMGVKIIEDLSQAERGDTVIVRSHGEPREFYEEAERRGIRLIDTSCVFVKKIHEIVSKAHEADRPVIVIGDRDHQEVKATTGCYEAAVIGSAEEAERYAEDVYSKAIAAPVIVCQTTIRCELMQEILDVFDRSGIEYELHRTICNATRDRQESCRQLAGQVDLMVVIGDKHSSNSRKLFDIAKNNCQNSVFIENASELLLKDGEKYTKIGVIAGASTPEWIIKEVISSMSENVTKNMEQNPMMDFMDDIEKSLRLPKPGDVIDGKVDQVMDDAVIVNMGCKKDGILRADEVVLEEGQKLSDVFKEGDDIQAKVIKSDEGEGGILLSKKRLVAVENYTELEEAMENKDLSW